MPWTHEGDVTRREEDLGDVVLQPGRDLHGSTRTVGDPPLGGALVRAVELVELDLMFTFQENHYSAATSGDDGRFRLRCVPEHRGLAVLASADPRRGAGG